MMINFDMKSKLFYILIVSAAAVLIYFSISAEKRSNAIVAVVESQKTAISFHKPVQIKAIHVSAGQHVAEGDLLLEVERPDLIMDRARLRNELELEESKQARLQSDFESKIKLLDIEMTGKIQRLNTEINKLQVQMNLKQARYADISSLNDNDSEISNPKNQADSIVLNSYLKEKSNLLNYSSNEKERLELLLAEDLKTLKIRMDFISNEQKALIAEEGALKQIAPFEGTIGTVNAQLMELLPPYATIISVYEEIPHTIKAYLNLSAEVELEVGQEVSVESASRNYSTKAEVIEIGSRIVEYQDLALQQNQLKLFGKEIFIQLPEDNSFLYGEQVYVYLLPETTE